METWQSVLIILSSSFALLLNSMMFFLVFRNRTLQTSFNATILNSSLADIVVSLNMLAYTIYVTTTTDNKSALCNLTGFINLLTFVSSVMSLAAVSINRYFLVCRRVLYDVRFTRLGTIFYITCVWFISTLLSIPPFLGWGRFAFHEGKSICFVDWNSSISYMFFMIGVCFCGPITATLTSLFLILRANRRVEITLKLQASDSKTPRSNRRNMRTAKHERKITLSILTVVVVFFVAWGPFVVVMFAETLGKTTVPPWIDFASLYSGLLNSTANPIVYLSLNSNFRQSMLDLLPRSQRTGHITVRSRKAYH